MKCSSCSGELRSSSLNHFVDLGNCFIIIKGVPCMECVDCGEKILSGVTIAHIEGIVERLKNMFLTEVAVVNYTDSVA